MALSSPFSSISMRASVVLATVAAASCALSHSLQEVTTSNSTYEYSGDSGLAAAAPPQQPLGPDLTYNYRTDQELLDASERADLLHEQRVAAAPKRACRPPEAARLASVKGPRRAARLLLSAVGDGPRPPSAPRPPVSEARGQASAKPEEGQHDKNDDDDTDDPEDIVHGCFPPLGPASP